MELRHSLNRYRALRGGPRATLDARRRFDVKGLGTAPEGQPFGAGWPFSLSSMHLLTKSAR
jgi:hypothetical protein